MKLKIVFLTMTLFLICLAVMATYFLMMWMNAYKI